MSHHLDLRFWTPVTALSFSARYNPFKMKSFISLILVLLTPTSVVGKAIGPIGHIAATRRDVIGNSRRSSSFDMQTVGEEFEIVQNCGVSALFSRCL